VCSLPDSEKDDPNTILGGALKFEHGPVAVENHPSLYTKHLIGTTLLTAETRTSRACAGTVPQSAPNGADPKASAADILRRPIIAAPADAVKRLNKHATFLTTVIKG
jgi:hypothetical protein